jgi:hypothetical protein
MNFSQSLRPSATFMALLLATACGPGVEAKTVTNTDTSRTAPNGETTQTNSTDTQILQSDGSKKTKRVEEVETQSREDDQTLTSLLPSHGGLVGYLDRGDGSTEEL